MKEKLLKRNEISVDMRMVSLQCRRFWRSIEWFAAILDSLQTGRIGARMTECRRGGGRGGEKKIFLSPPPPPSPIFLSLSHTW